MSRIRKSTFVPFACDAMYALVEDVEAYPQFLPWCERAVVQSREGDVVIATVAVSKGPIRHNLTTRNLLAPGRRIEMHLVSGPFKTFNGLWQFEPLGAGGCRVSLDLQFEFASRLQSMTLGPLFEQVSRTMVDAFQARAAAKYGTA